MPGIGIGTNTLALQSQRALGKHSTDVSAASERLASGLRINRASDDPAGLAVSSELNLDRRVFTQAVRNANDAISAVSIAEGALGQLSIILERLRELATQASNGILGYDQRSSLNDEAFALTSEYNRISQGTKYNGLSILDGSLDSLAVQLGYGDAGNLSFSSTEELERIIGTNNFTFDNSSLPDRDGHFIDIDGDGDLDMVTDETDVRIYKNDGTGNFTLDQTISGSDDASSVGFADFDGDGLLDIVIGRKDFIGGGLYIAKQLGGGTFAPISTAGSIGVDELLVDDFDKDGLSDVVVRDGATLTFYKGNGTATPLTEGDFTAQGTFTLSTSNIPDMQLADFDGDGNMDIALRGNDFLLTLAGDGTGSFSESFSIQEAGITGMAIGDIDSDGRADIITGYTGNRSGARPPGGPVIFRGKGDGSLEDPIVLNKGDTLDNFLQGVFLADMNNDGNLDIITGEAADDSGFLEYGYVYLNDGAGNYTVSQAITESTSGIAHVLDLNGDGAVDIVSEQSGKLYLNGTTTSTTMERVSLGSQANALEALQAIAAQEDLVHTQLGVIGSIASRLKTAVSHLGSITDNYATASSRITDIDVASETANLVRSQILQSVASAVSAQANLQPSLAILLLAQPENSSNSQD